MFGLFGPKESADRRDLRESFENVTRKLRTADKWHLFKVALILNSALQMFEIEFGNAERFRAVEYKQKVAYIDSIVALTERKTRAKDEPEAALAYFVFQCWLTSVFMDDAALERQFQKELLFISNQRL